MNSTVQKLEATPVDTPVAVTPAIVQDPLDRMPWLPFTLSLEIPIVNFTIRDLLGLTKGSIVETACHHTSDVPLRVNRLLIGWTEFEVIGNRLAVRITDLA